MKNAGFTLLETIVAVGLIVTGLISSLALINTSLIYVSNIQDRLVAANLVMEGIEVIRNIRDNNWVNPLASGIWNTGIESGTYQVAYNSLQTAPYGSGNPLFLNSNGFYVYDRGGSLAPFTPFIRKIEIRGITTDEMRVISTVSWQRRGKIYEIKAEEHLFNWK